MNLNVMRVVDERISHSTPNDITVVLKEGAQTTNYMSLPANGYSNQSINFNLNNIGTQVYRDPRLCIGMQSLDVIQVTNTGATEISAIITADNYSHKCWPCNRLWAITHQINGATEVLNTYDVIDALSKMNILPEDMNWVENTLPDYIADLAPATGSNFTPQTPYASTLPGDGVFKPRTLNYTVTSYWGDGTVHQNASSVPGSATGGGNATIVITSTYYEPLISPFLNITSKNGRGAVGVTGEVINLAVQPNIFKNMVNFYVPSTITTLTVNSKNTYIAGTVAVPITGQPSVSISLAIPTLYPIVLTPYPDMQKDIPYEEVLEYNKITVQVNSNVASSVSPQTTLPPQSSLVAQYDHLPELIAWYIRTTNDSRDELTTDKYLQYLNGSFTMNQGNPQLNGASQDQVYDISARNGLKVPRACWKQSILNYPIANGSYMYGCGSIVLLSPALDLNAQEGLMTGTTGQFTFQLTNGTFRNNTDTAFNAISLYVLAIQKGVLVRTGLQYNSKLLDVLPSQVRDAKMLPAVVDSQYRHALKRNSFMGGGIGDFFRDVWSKAKKVGQYAWQHPHEVIDVAQKVAPYAKKLAKGGARKKQRHGGDMIEGVDAFYE